MLKDRLIGWLDGQDVLQLLHISQRTLQKWRTEGTIKFSRIGGKLFYRVTDIEEMLEANLK